MENLGSAVYSRTPNAPWQRDPFPHEPRENPPWVMSSECYAMAGMARGLTLMLLCTRGEGTEDVEALSGTCTRWQFALALAVQRLLGDDE